MAYEVGHSGTSNSNDKTNNFPFSANSRSLKEKELHGEASEEDRKSNNRLNSQDGKTYPSPLKLNLIVLGLCLAVLCMSIDNTIIGTAIPKITDEFNSLNDVGWYGSAYLLTVCAFQFAFAKLYTFYSIKWVYLLALFIFEVGSLICGAAPNSTTLIVGRAIAGIGGAGVGSGGFVLTIYAVPLRKRPTYTGLIGAMYGLGSVVGPLLGGAFTDHPKLTWRWCFYINLPVGAITSLIIVLLMTTPTPPKPSLREQLMQMDPLGTTLFLPALICLLLPLQWGGTRYAWNDARVVVPLVLSAVLFAAFVASQLYSGDRAMVPPRVFKNRNVWGSTVYGSFIVAAFFSTIYYVCDQIPCIPSLS
jgi:MFS family permease